MVFIELIINRTTNKLEAFQEFPIDRGKEHDWGLGLDQIFERIEQPSSLTEEIQRYVWDPILKQLEFDPAIKTKEEQKAEDILIEQQTWDAQQTQITNATSVEEIKSLLVDLLGSRPTEEAELG